MEFITHEDASLCVEDGIGLRLKGKVTQAVLGIKKINGGKFLCPWGRRDGFLKFPK
jgi:hypothetical protein